MRRAIFTTIYSTLKEYGTKGQPVTTDELSTLTGLAPEQIAASLNHYIKREAEAGRTGDVERIRSHVYRYEVKLPKNTEPDLGEQPEPEIVIQPSVYERVGVTSSGHPVVKHPVTGTLYRLEQL